MRNDFRAQPLEARPMQSLVGRDQVPSRMVLFVLWIRRQQDDATCSAVVLLQPASRLRRIDIALDAK